MYSQMGGCFCKSQQAAEPATKLRASSSSRSGSHVHAVETPSSNTDVLPELATGISRLKQRTDSGVASTSIECCSIGLPSSRYGPASAPLRCAIACLRCSAGQSRQDSSIRQTVPDFLMSMQYFWLQQLQCSHTNVCPPTYVTWQQKQSRLESLILCEGPQLA